MKKQIKIRVYPDGTIKSQTVNIKGKTCLKYIKEIENLTNAKTVKSEFTNEYYQNQIVEDSYTIGQQVNEN